MATTHPSSSIQQRVQRWGPLLAEAQQELQPLINALLLAWAAGPTVQASAHRQFGESLPRVTEAEQYLLERCAAAFGQARIDALRNATRPEPALLTFLEELSHEVWQAGASRRAELLTLLGKARLAALLTVACWRERKERIDYAPGQGDVLEDLYRYWLEQTEARRNDCRRNGTASQEQG
jgi:hypothetical protein